MTDSMNNLLPKGSYYEEGFFFSFFFFFFYIMIQNSPPAIRGKPQSGDSYSGTFASPRSISRPPCNIHGFALYKKPRLF